MAQEKRWQRSEHQGPWLTPSSFPRGPQRLRREGAWDRRVWAQGHPRPEYSRGVEEGPRGFQSGRDLGRGRPRPEGVVWKGGGLGRKRGPLFTVCPARERERDRDSERHTEMTRQRDRRWRETEKQRERETEEETDRQTCTHTELYCP